MREDVKTKNLIVCGLVVCVVGVAIYIHSRPGPTEPQAPIEQPDRMAKDGPVCQTLPAGEVGDVVKYIPHRTSVERLKDFHGMSPSEQGTLATTLMRDRNLSGDEVEFLKAELANHTLDPVTRNNIANALTMQNNPDPELHRVFLAMVDDPTESAVWRDYSLQFLSTTLPFSNEPDVVINKLKQVAEIGRGDIQGTAAVHLAMHEQEGLLELDDTFSVQAVRALHDESVSEATKTSLLAIIGQREDTANLGLVRTFAKQNDKATLKRTAVASLGLIGEAEDLPLVQAALIHKNRAVQLAAKGAEKRLQTRFPETESVESHIAADESPEHTSAETNSPDSSTQETESAESRVAEDDLTHNPVTETKGTN